jgi:sodium transport system permease protein
MSRRDAGRQLWAMVRKEGLEALRDRRAMLAALVYPLLGPVLVALVFAGAQHSVEQGQSSAVAIVGAAHAPALVGALVADGVTVSSVAANAVHAQDDGDDHDVVVWIADDFQAAMLAGRPAKVRIDADLSRPGVRWTVRNVAQKIAAYSQRVAFGRAVARGVHPEIMSPVLVETRDLATSAQHAASLLHMVPMFVLLAIFVGAMQVAIDATAGERERGSLEPLLLHPVSTEIIAIGKWAIAALMSLAAGALTLTLTVLTLPLLPTEALGVRVTLAPEMALTIAALLLPMAPMAAGALLFAASFARSFKEAQTWLSALLFIPMLPGLLGSTWQLEAAPWMWPVPALGQHVLAVAALRGEPVSWLALASAGSVCLLVAALGVLGTARMLRRERALFLGQ